jgi:hypothetical protein
MESEEISTQQSDVENRRVESGGFARKYESGESLSESVEKAAMQLANTNPKGSSWSFGIAWRNGNCAKDCSPMGRFFSCRLDKINSTSLSDDDFGTLMAWSAKTGKSSMFVLTALINGTFGREHIDRLSEICSRIPQEGTMGAEMYRIALISEVWAQNDADGLVKFINSVENEGSEVGRFRDCLRA